MRSLIPLMVAALALSACTSYHQFSECQDEVGAMPNAWTSSLGAFGTLANMSDPRVQEYHRAVGACVERKKLAIQS